MKDKVLRAVLEDTGIIYTPYETPIRAVILPKELKLIHYKINRLADALGFAFEEPTGLPILKRKENTNGSKAEN